jgi:hypothetical protein
MKQGPTILGFYVVLTPFLGWNYNILTKKYSALQKYELPVFLVIREGINLG